MAPKFVFSRVKDVKGLVVMPATILMSKNDPYGWCGAECDTLLRDSNTDVMLNVLYEGFPESTDTVFDYSFAMSVRCVRRANESRW